MDDNKYIKIEGFYEPFDRSINYSVDEMSTLLSSSEFEEYNSGKSFEDIVSSREDPLIPKEVKKILEEDEEDVSDEEVIVEDEEVDSESTPKEKKDNTSENNKPKVDLSKKYTTQKENSSLADMAISTSIREISRFFTLSTFTLIIPILLFGILNLLPMTILSGLILGVTGFNITPIILLIIITLIMFAKDLFPVAEKDFNETVMSKEDTKALKDELLSLSDHPGYVRTIKKVVFFTQGSGSDKSSYAKGLNKISLNTSQIVNSKLSIVTHELAHIYYGDTLLLAISNAQYGLFKFLYRFLLFVIFFVPALIVYVIMNVATPLLKSQSKIQVYNLTSYVRMFSSYTESASNYLYEVFTKFSSKRMEYRADAFTLVNGTSDEVIQYFSNIEDTKLSIKERLKKGIFDTHPQPSKRVRNIEKLQEREMRMQEAINLRPIDNSKYR